MIKGDKNYELNWEEMGLRMTIPEGAIDEDKEATITIKALATGKFTKPKGTVFASVIYLISSSNELLKEVKLEIEHCAILTTEEQCQSMSFVIASCHNQRVYHFEPIKGGVFTCKSLYASIILPHFCGVGIVAENVPMRYSLQLHYSSDLQGLQNCWRAHFVATKKLASLNNVSYKF